jgi:hypothetical protein
MTDERPNPGHGHAAEVVPDDVFLSDDPWLALVHADMGAYREAHPCVCPALCVCSDDSAGVGAPDLVEYGSWW